MSRTLIIGYGNPLRGDDALGWKAAELLQQRVQSPDVEILALHQLTPELMESISRVDLVIFIDAAVGPNPGEIHHRSIEPLATSHVSFTHHATPEALLAGALKLYGHAPTACMLTVTGADFELSDRLSPAVSLSLEVVSTAALRLLA